MEQIYFGGTILTMEEELLAESVLVKDGWIEAVGTKDELMAAFPKAAPIDLHHNTMMPAFIDSHSHFFAVANGYLEVDLEGAADFQEIQERILDFIKKNQIQKGTWVKAKGYDHNTLKEKKHPDRTFLDQCTPDNPLVIQHKSGHVGVFNSLGLEKLHITEQTPEPEGGRIEKAAGRLTGYMEETAFVSYLRKTPIPGAREMKQAAVKAQDFYASYGIATVQDGMSVVQMIPLYKQLIQEGKLKLDLVVYPEKKALSAFREQMRESYRRYDGHFKINGIKIFLDGSPQARTAWMEEPYVGESEYRGYGTLEDEKVTEAFLDADQEQCQLLAHCNGDRACRQYIECAALAKKKGADLKAMRPVMIHAQFLPQKLMEQVKNLDIIPSFFLAHIYYWGEIHRKNMGKERADLISPAASAAKENIPFTLHQDTPVIKPDMLETVWCAVQRKTKEGHIMGEEERISMLEALKAVTIHGAYEYSEESEKGTIQKGKKADFVILDQNPMEIKLDAVPKIQVLATIKEGKMIWKKE